MPSFFLKDIAKAKTVNLDNLSFSLDRKDLDKIPQIYNNGLSKYTENIKVEYVTDIKKCEVLWKKYFLGESLFDTWEFREAFQKNYPYKVFFTTLYKNNKLIAILPLCYDETYKLYCWFGTNWQEDNKFFVTDPHYIPILIYFSPKPISLTGIIPFNDKFTSKLKLFEKDDSKYMLDIINFKSLDDYFSLLPKKKRYNLKRDMKNIENKKVKVFINKFSDFKNIVKIANERFSKKKELSSWIEEPYMIDTFKSILNTPNKDITPRMISVYINNKVSAVDLIALYKDTYYTLVGGYDIFKYPGIGNYMNLLEIKDAIALKAKKIDFLQNDYGWKHSMFNEVPLLKYYAE